MMMTPFLLSGVTFSLALAIKDTLMNEETKLCLEPAGPFNADCLFYDIGADVKQGMRLAECDGGSKQQWIFRGDGHISPAEDPRYCMTIPPPYWERTGKTKEWFSVWLCHCDYELPPDSDSVERTIYVVNGMKNGTTLEYANDSGTYIIGKPDKYNKVKLCHGGDDPDSCDICSATHWMSSAFTSYDEQESSAIMFA